MLGCEDTQKLISLSRDHRVGFWRRTQIRLHIAMCGVCRGYYRFVNRIGSHARRDVEGVTMPSEMRARLYERLKTGR